MIKSEKNSNNDKWKKKLNVYSTQFETRNGA